MCNSISDSDSAATLEEMPPTTEAKVLVGEKLLATGEAFIEEDRSGGWFLPTDDSESEIPFEGASMIMWGTDDALPLRKVFRDRTHGRAFHFTLAA
jgi:hypothetical protein